MSQPPRLTQYVRLPTLGDAWVEREPDRPDGVFYFDLDLERNSEPAGAVVNITVRAGRWVATVDQATDAPSATRRWLWIAVGVPALLLLGLTGCVLGGILVGAVRLARRWFRAAASGPQPGAS